MKSIVLLFNVQHPVSKQFYFERKYFRAAEKNLACEIRRLYVFSYHFYSLIILIFELKIKEMHFSHVKVFERA